jgi:hypothetical protein
MLSDLKATILRHVPPPEDTLHAGELYLGPAAGAALVVFALVMLILGRKAALAAGSLAMVAGFAVANYRHTLFPWWPEGKGWHWLPLLFLLAQFDGLFARVPSVPLWGGWRLRLVIGFLTALIIVPHGLHRAWPVVVDIWPYPFAARAFPLIAFMLVVAFGWAGSEAVARQSAGGSVALGLSLSLFGASLVILHAHWASFAESITFPAAALLGIAIVAFIRKSDVGGALPGIALILPSMLLVTHDQMAGSHTIPWYAFVLAALPPLTIGLLAIPPLSRTQGFVRWLLFWGLCMGPTLAAVLIAARAETVASGGGDEWTHIANTAGRLT